MLVRQGQTNLACHLEEGRCTIGKENQQKLGNRAVHWGSANAKSAVLAETRPDSRWWRFDPAEPVIHSQAAISFSFANGSASRKVCIGVLPKHQRPWCGLCSLYSTSQASRSTCSSSIVR